MNYFRLTIHKNSRPMGKNTDWQVYDFVEKPFNTIAEAKEYLSKEYFYCKTKRRSYIDGKDGKGVPAGWIYCFKSNPFSYDDCKHYEQHWVSLYKIHSTPVDF